MIFTIGYLNDPDFVLDMPLDSFFSLHSSCKRLSAQSEAETMQQLILATGAMFSKEVGKEVEKYFHAKAEQAGLTPTSDMDRLATKHGRNSKKKKIRYTG